MAAKNTFLANSSNQSKSFYLRSQSYIVRLGRKAVNGFDTGSPNHAFNI